MLISPLFHPAHPVEQIPVFPVILVQPLADTRSAEEQHPQLKELLQTVHTGLMSSGGTKHLRGVLAIFISNIGKEHLGERLRDHIQSPCVLISLVQLLLVVYCFTQLRIFLSPTFQFFQSRLFKVRLSAFGRLAINRHKENHLQSSVFQCILSTIGSILASLDR